MTWQPETLPWLLPPPQDFRDRCRELSGLTGADFAATARHLASHGLGYAQSDRLGRLLIQARVTRRAPLTPTPFKLGILGTGTLDLLAPCLTASALRHGIDLEVVTGRYGQLVQDALDADSPVVRARPDAVLLTPDHRSLPFPPPEPQARGEGVIATARDQLDTVIQTLKGHGIHTVILQTVPLPPDSLFGHLDRQTPLALAGRLRVWNDHLAQRARADDALLLDAEALAALVGTGRWYDPVQWHVAKLPFDQTLIPCYADHVARLVAAARGKSRKCLVLDLDNTLWGGVIGDDGLEGIQLGQGNPLGEAFVAVQTMARDYRRRGVVLAVCSKNNEDTARRPFREHGEMVLREEDIALLVANWQPKSANLRRIAEQLNLGLDALVLLDDNPVERHEVRTALPTVAVPELPDDPALYPRVLWAAGYFEAVHVSAEDFQRADQYRANLARQELAATTGDLSAYLRSLAMRARLAPFRERDRARITQLVNKTNQFNLTTRRYTQAEIAALEQAPDTFTLQVRLEDRFGDNGIIALVVCRREDDTWLIDTWLMSCRVFERQVEHLVLDHLVQAARQQGLTALVGLYRPTDRNGLVQDLYRKFGFQPQDATGERWRLPLEGYREHHPPIAVVWED
ncbi:MAG: HAD family hydrolase [Magnetococcales bacterium]|nr:HAD family hydrolase [Magnetococcales bacterium]